ncbi:MAG: hypothetical protein AAF622_10600 [Cyanobacteria bacterium P01_C01_bin.147]
MTRPRTDAVAPDFGPYFPNTGEIGGNILQIWGIKGAFASVLIGQG